MGGLKKREEILFRWQFALKTEENGKVFVKIGHSDRKGQHIFLKQKMGIEKSCLKGFSGLAVPKLVRNPNLPIVNVLFKGKTKPFYFTQSYIEGDTIASMNLTPDRMIGCWLFLLEQFVAFRKLGILYSDIKQNNILYSSTPLQIHIIDFDSACPIAANNLYLSSQLRYTRNLEAPEHTKNKKVKESVVVYQMGMLLGSLLIQMDNTTKDELKRGLQALKKTLLRNSSREFTRIALSTLSEIESKRPRTLLELFNQIESQKYKLSNHTIETFENLRRPYLKRLKLLGFK